MSWSQPSAESVAGVPCSEHACRARAALAPPTLDREPRSDSASSVSNSGAPEAYHSPTSLELLSQAHTSPPIRATYPQLPRPELLFPRPHDWASPTAAVYPTPSAYEFPCPPGMKYAYDHQDCAPAQRAASFPRPHPLLGGVPALLSADPFAHRRIVDMKSCAPLHF